jgi:hypothetical protein
VFADRFGQQANVGKDTFIVGSMANALWNWVTAEFRKTVQEVSE